MKLFSKKLFLGGLIISGLVLIIGIYFFTQSKTENSVIKQTSQGDTTSRVLKNSNGLSERDDADPWEVWVKTATDAAVEKYVAAAAQIDWILTDAELVELRQNVRSIAIAAAEQEKKKSDIPPLISDSDIQVEVTRAPTYDIVGKKHTGPQTVDALMDAFHADHNNFHATSRSDEWYPPRQWIQMLLDRGITIQNAAEYSEYMMIRGPLVSIENDPEFREMRSRGLGIPASDIDALKMAQLEKDLNFKQRLHNARRSDDRITFIGFAGPNNETELPFYAGRKITYVQFEKHAEGFSGAYHGATLTQEQRFNLRFRGIEPEGIEIIYINEMGKILEEKPSPVTREEFLKMMSSGESPPPEDWWDPDSPVPDSEELEEFLPPKNRDTELDSLRDRAREEAAQQAEAAARSEYEKFVREVRQLEKFATMSDAEIAAELEKQLRQRLFPNLLTEDSLEDALRERITPKPLTSERFDKAMQTLQNHGPKEGLRRLAKEDPELAEYFRRNSQKVPPKRSQPSNADD